MDDMPQNLMLRKIGTVGGGKIVRVTDPRLPHTGYTRTDTIASHSDATLLIEAVWELVDGLEAYDEMLHPDDCQRIHCIDLQDQWRREVMNSLEKLQMYRQTGDK